MSSATDTHEEHSGPHEGPIKTPKQLILAVFFSFVVPVFAIVLLVKYVTSAALPGAGSEGLQPEAVAARIQPVGRVEIKDVSDPASLASGEQVYQAQCVACHGAGVAGSPRLGDEAAWAPRLKTGYDALLASALKGKGSMGAQGGGDYTDFEIARAVVYMANKSGGKLEEPKGPAAAVATTAAAPTPAAAPAPAASPAPAPAAAATPAAPVVTAAAAAGGAPPALYTQACAVCHVAGVAGAPKLGDKAAWAPRIKTGNDALVAAVIKGKGAMPARGGGATLSDAEIKAAVEYMVAQSK